MYESKYGLQITRWARHEPLAVQAYLVVFVYLKTGVSHGVIIDACGAVFDVFNCRLSRELGAFANEFIESHGVVAVIG